MYQYGIPNTETKQFDRNNRLARNLQHYFKNKSHQKSENKQENIWYEPLLIYLSVTLSSPSKGTQSKTLARISDYWKKHITILTFPVATQIWFVTYELQ